MRFTSVEITCSPRVKLYLYNTQLIITKTFRFFTRRRSFCTNKIIISLSESHFFEVSVHKRRHVVHVQNVLSPDHQGKSFILIIAYVVTDHDSKTTYTDLVCTHGPLKLIRFNTTVPTRPVVREDIIFIVSTHYKRHRTVY